MKFVLGTANFGNNYGLANSAGLNEECVRNILSSAYQLGIRTIDTASSYGESEILIGKFAKNDFEIITKIKNNINAPDIFGMLRQESEYSLHRLKRNSVYAILLHDVNVFNDIDKLNEHLNAMQKIKKLGYCSKVGVSIYEPDVLGSLNNMNLIDFVQAPLNVFDMRIVKSGWLRKLKNYGIEFHARSIFLRGLLLDGVDKDGYKKKYINQFNSWSEYCQNNSVSKFSAAISNVGTISGVDGIVLGFDTKRQLAELNHSHEQSHLPIFNADEIPVELIDPRLW